jgi:hypothetical protein
MPTDTENIPPLARESRNRQPPNFYAGEPVFAKIQPKVKGKASPKKAKAVKVSKPKDKAAKPSPKKVKAKPLSTKKPIPKKKALSVQNSQRSPKSKPEKPRDAPSKASPKRTPLERISARIATFKDKSTLFESKIENLNLTAVEQKKATQLGALNFDKVLLDVKKVLGSEVIAHSESCWEACLEFSIASSNLVNKLAMKMRENTDEPTSTTDDAAMTAAPIITDFIKNCERSLSDLWAILVHDSFTHSQITSAIRKETIEKAIGYLPTCLPGLLPSTKAGLDRLAKACEDKCIPKGEGEDSGFFRFFGVSCPRQSSEKTTNCSGLSCAEPESMETQTVVQSISCLVFSAPNQCPE